MNEIYVEFISVLRYCIYFQLIIVVIFCEKDIIRSKNKLNVVYLLSLPYSNWNIRTCIRYKQIVRKLLYVYDVTM